MKALLCCGVLMGCTEDVVVPLGTFDENLLVREQGWVLTSEIRDNGTSKTDLFATYAPCLRDDVYRFRADLTYRIEEGGSRCDTLHSTVKATGSWRLSAGVLTLRPEEFSNQPFTIQQVSTSFNLMNLTENKLTYTYLELEANGTVSAVTTATMEPAGTAVN